jgi:polyphosphate kinase
VKEPALRKRLRDEILEAYLKDTVKARILQPNGEYTRPPRGTHPFEAQVKFMELAGGTISAPSATSANVDVDTAAPAAAPAKQVARKAASRRTPAKAAAKSL